MSTPIGKLMPPTAKMMGKTYIRIFCWRTIGLPGAEFFMII